MTRRTLFGCPRQKIIPDFSDSYLGLHVRLLNVVRKLDSVGRLVSVQLLNVIQERKTGCGQRVAQLCICAREAVFQASIP